MRPSFHSFSEELLLIKLAEDEVVDRPTAKKFLRGLLVYGPSIGLGWGAGHLVGKTVLPKILKGTTQGQRLAASAITGGLASVLSSRAFDVLTRERPK